MSSIKSAQAAQGYLRANQRPACNNCAHGEERVCITPTWWCDVGSFLTTALAICSAYQAKKEPRV